MLEISARIFSMGELMKKFIWIVVLLLCEYLVMPFVVFCLLKKEGIDAWRAKAVANVIIGCIFVLIFASI